MFDTEQQFVSQPGIHHMFAAMVLQPFVPCTMLFHIFLEKNVQLLSAHWVLLSRGRAELWALFLCVHHCQSED